MSEDEREVLAIEQALAKARKAREKVAKKERAERAEAGVHVVQEKGWTLKNLKNAG
jgi:hypothetical protein